MSRDYYFKKWAQTISNLKEIIELDLEYQRSNVNDAEWSDAEQRLNTALARYMGCYNDAFECFGQNLQTQKHSYIQNIVTAVEHRILELIHQIRNLDGGYHQFLSIALANIKLTMYDVEMSKIANIYKRPEHVQAKIAECFSMAHTEEEISVQDEANNNTDESTERNISGEETTGKLDMTAIYAVKKKVSLETSERKRIISLIQAQERARQVTRHYNQQKLKRQMWEKELKGTLKPQAPYEIRSRAAAMIQQVIRAYFDIKRKRIQDCRLNKILGLQLCDEPSNEATLNYEQKQKGHQQRYEQYKERCRADCEGYRKKFIEKKGKEIDEDLRDFVGAWFRKWYKEVKYFYELPRNKGCASILYEEIPSPEEWLKQYETYLENKKANKNKSSLQIKWEEQSAKKANMMARRAELSNKRKEDRLKEKLRKNPTLHPGYNYPKSRCIERLHEVVQVYIRAWSDLDHQGIDGVKEKCVEELNMSEAFKEAKIDICKTVNDYIRTEYKSLMNALKKDYVNNEEEMPQKMKQTPQRKTKIKKLKKLKTLDGAALQAKLMHLNENGFVVQYPRTKFEEFYGDSNFAGSDLRFRMLKEALPLGAEIRLAWWENCIHMAKGKHALVVGARGSGKTMLVHIAATLYDAVLYVMEPSQFLAEIITPAYLEQIVHDVAQCAGATRPSVIYLRHVHQLFSKPASEEQRMNSILLKRYFLRILFKQIKKYDNVMVIGSCVDPWRIKCNKLLKKFPAMLLMPDSTFSVVSLVLRNWVLRNRPVPSDLNIPTLSHLFQGYPLGYIIQMLNEFLTTERIVRIAAYGLKIQELYDYMVGDGSVPKVEYQRYLKWYNEKTAWGKSAQKTLRERTEFVALVDKWKKKMKQKALINQTK